MEWKDRTVEMKVRKGHGPWIQVRIQVGEEEKLYIMRPVKSFRELGKQEKDPLLGGK